ncbi:hypothetical protein [uncultured Desulfuromonas sp.]|uniref:hypothetical protein n=1 Tax=uncultured Desulfuromonas sp. TaxID=181013 RepID=UPI00261AE2AC|nr:hypothetical protein [uncultured Desulfuromonas sp.]
MLECELLSQCGFFRKHETTLDLPCRGFVQAYCRGPRREACQRRAYLLLHGFSPPDDLLPNGQVVPMSYQAATE